MKILIVEDQPVARTILSRALVQLGHEVVATPDGEAAWQRLQQEPLRAVVSDWMMPKVNGLDLCRRIRARSEADYVYFILLTSLDASRENKRTAAEAGVDDFLHKPLSSDELWTRLRTAERILNYATQVRRLERLLPICSYCKKVRDDRNYWQQLESYVREHTGSEFSHAICPECYERVVIPQLRAAGIAADKLPPFRP